MAELLCTFPFSLIYLGPWLLTFTSSSELRWIPNIKTDSTCSCRASPGTTHRKQSKRGDSLEVYIPCLTRHAFLVTDKVLQNPSVLLAVAQTWTATANGDSNRRQQGVTVRVGQQGHDKYDCFVLFSFWKAREEIQHQVFSLHIATVKRNWNKSLLWKGKV